MNAPDLSTETLGKLTRIFAAYPELIEVILFGSRATGKASARSDIDLATRGIVDERRLGRLALDLDDASIPQKCGVQAYEHIRYTPLRRHIEAFGTTIYSRATAPTVGPPRLGS